MAVKIFSCLAAGLHGRLIEVEVDILRGLSAFTIVGLGDTSVQEAKERIRSAIKNSGFEYPQTKKIINLAPAHLKKHGPQFDLPMAVGLLAASDQVNAKKFEDTLIVGELALDGCVRPINGIITIAIFAKEQGCKRLVLPEKNLDEANLIKGVEYIGVKNLRDAIGFLRKPEAWIAQNAHAEQNAGYQKNANAHQNGAGISADAISLDDVKGQEQAKRALVIAAAGGHHILFTGPPGVGKTMLAKALPSILPKLSEEEKIQLMQIYSCAGLFQEMPCLRPFRQVHPTCSLLSLTGGGSIIKPGEISLSHNGVLFLDEIAEFPRAHLESLRQPLEEKKIFLSRSGDNMMLPANFMLVAGLNPCPCGYFGDRKKKCVCRPYQIIQYQKKLSGPILDRIDLTVEFHRQNIAITKTDNQLTKKMAIKMIETARAVQEKRFVSQKYKLNSCMEAKDIVEFCPLNPEANNLITVACEKMNLSGRAYHKVLKVARTIADLSVRQNIHADDIAEALQYRQNNAVCN